MSKIKEVILLTCTCLFLATDTTPGVLSFFLESTFSGESRKIGGRTVETDQAGEESGTQYCKEDLKEQRMFYLERRCCNKTQHVSPSVCSALREKKDKPCSV